MERGKYLEANLKKLELVKDLEFAQALKKCEQYVITRLGKRTLFGAHTDERLGTDPVDYYVSFAYNAIIYGTWEWKDERTFGQQMIRIADNRVGKEVEKYRTEHDGKFAMAGEDIDERFYSEDPPPEKTTIVQEAVYAKKIELIEEAVKDDEELAMFWECVKEGMKRDAIAKFMEKLPRQIDKLKEKLVKKIRTSPHFELI